MNASRMIRRPHPMRDWALSAALALCAGTVLAQAASAPGPGMGGMGGMGQGMSGMGPGMGAGMGAGMGGMRGRQAAARAGGDFTPGWAMMTKEERNEHRNQMRSMKTHDECRAYIDKHHEQMAARAKEKGQTLSGPRRDACAGLKK